MGDGHVRRGGGGRGNRRSSHEAQSSSEYSSSYSQGAGSQPSPGPPYTMAYPRPHDSPETQSEENDSIVRPSSRLPPQPVGLADPEETSDESVGSERGDDLPLVGRGQERRGKKGLSHAELAMAERRVTAEDDDSIAGAPVDRGDDTEDEEDQLGDIEVGAQASRDTEEEGEDYATVLQRANVRAASTRRRSPWAKCHPIVTETAKMLEIRGAGPSELGYAKFVGAGKITVDYLVRKQSIVIGRSSSMADCVIKSDARLISKKHARLFWALELKEWVIVCLSEKNGMLVNGIPIVLNSIAMPVKSRDLIEIGDAAFFFMAAATPVIHVNNILYLEKEILAVRAQEERERVESEEERRRHEPHYSSLRQGRLLHPPRKFKEKLKKSKANESHRYRRISNHSDRPVPPKRRPFGIDDEGPGDPGYSRKRRKQIKSSKSHNSRQSNGSDYPMDGQSGEEREVFDANITGDDGEYKPRPSTPKGSDRILDYVHSKRKTDRDVQEGIDPTCKRADDDDVSKLKEDWTKKERTDFTRALFAVGVDPIFDDDSVLAYYDWTRFRKIAELSKKSDDMLEDFYIRLMTDVNELLEDEEREKRTKGPRTKHKPGCDCIVCENTRKSRRRKQEERDGPFEDDKAGESEGGEKVEMKDNAESRPRLVGLVTAQKLRVRLGIHEAARKVSSYAGETVFTRLGKQQDLHVRDFPNWWKAGFHDRPLMLGTAIHGVGQWSDIWHDPKLKAFRKQRERDRDEVEWPSTQAAMKRVRDLASLINSELKREAKRAAKDDRGYYPSDGLSKAKMGGSPHRAYGKGKGVSSRKKPTASRQSGYRSEDQDKGMLIADVGNVDAESGERSASDMEMIERRDASQVETEDEDEVEVEVEEEVEIEEDASGAEYGARDDPNSGGLGEGTVAEKKPVVAGDISTDDEDDDNIQYETASETGSD